jgi:hypothetical protein
MDRGVLVRRWHPLFEAQPVPNDHRLAGRAGTVPTPILGCVGSTTRRGAMESREAHGERGRETRRG